ncbi:MAG: RNA polymerase sigma factor [Bacteroidetes bacterium]|nr:RNA polymerase sigma factor [Bacteroidota bacterium]
MKVWTDKELLEKFRQPETRNYGFNLIVQSYTQRIYWHVRRMVIDHDDANDLTQDIFIKIWKGLDGFNEDSKLFTWIYRIATNECITFLNKKRKRFFIPIVNIENDLAHSLESSTHYTGDEIQLKLQKALLTLPEKQRMVFNMKYFDELKYEEIAEITGTSVGALKASYHLASKKIEEILNKD